MYSFTSKCNFILYIPFLIALTFSCSKEIETIDTYQVAEGKTMGTYYRVTYKDSLNRDFFNELDSILIAINDDVSTYITSSTISRFNQSESTFSVPVSATHFIENFKYAQMVADLSTQMFDPTVGPLINYWGFGYTGRKPVTTVDSAKVDSLLKFVGLKNIEWIEKNDSILFKKKFPQVELDFGGIAQGYAIDVLAAFLDKKGVKNYLVDLGGEFSAKNKNAKGAFWQVGINIPREDAEVNAIQTIFSLKNETISTSGNYRNFHEVKGVKYSHTLNPYTGFPEKNTLLSVSVFGPKCTMADGLATACMAMGFDKAQLLLEYLPGYEGYFIFSKPDGQIGTHYTSALKARIDKLKTVK
jgi:thiamine biosynthesis lipoprotein